MYMGSSVSVCERHDVGVGEAAREKTAKYPCNHVICGGVECSTAEEVVDDE